MGILAEMYSTGVLVKTDPLPPGRYWIDVFEKDIDAWVGWSGGNMATVHVEKTEFYQGTTKVAQVLGWVYFPWQWAIGNPEMPDRAFIIFDVSQPTPWGVANRLGWPNVAPKGQIETSDDTVQKPKPEDTLPEWYTYAKWGGIAVIGILGIFAVTSLVKEFRS